VRLTEFDSSPEVLRRLVELVAEHNLAELEIEDGSLRISVKGVVAPVAETQVAHSFVQTGLPHPAPAGSAPAPAAVAVDKRAGLKPLESPMVGTFYSAAAPEDPPFIKPDDSMSVAQNIGLIEAMKVYSEIPAEASGRIVEIVVKNGDLVQLGQALAYVEPS